MPLSIFREYILQLNYFPETINPSTKKFDYILGFASENGTGQFVPNWNVAALSPEKVMELKKNPKVSVIISIGGVGSEFNPLPTIDWVTTAVGSIKAIIMQYKNQIDGIDIHYDVINNGHFASYIGEVIQRLKNDRELSIKVVSIAPTKKVQDHYRDLYRYNKHNIDWVDYRFYDQQFSSVDEFINFYNRVVAAFDDDVDKVLAGISIPLDPSIFQGIEALIHNKKMSGVFVWNADESPENKLQNL